MVTVPSTRCDGVLHPIGFEQVPIHHRNSPLSGQRSCQNTTSRRVLSAYPRAHPRDTALGSSIANCGEMKRSAPGSRNSKGPKRLKILRVIGGSLSGGHQGRRGTETIGRISILSDPAKRLSGVQWESRSSASRGSAVGEGSAVRSNVRTVPSDGNATPI